jgi:putative N6-adenine-specific DNA methylase
MSLDLIATTSFGLEAVVKRELQALGFADLRASNGKVTFPAALEDIPRANLWLRSAGRVQVKMGEFPATTFDALFEQTKALPWEDWIPPDGAFPVSGKAVKSTLGSVRACQAIVKKAIVERLRARHKTADLPESGALYPVQVALRNDVALLTLDTSGSGLNKRGYRGQAGEAALRETLAAALVQLSFWERGRLLIDPMCGAGTILIEAALIGRNIAPGLRRGFAAEKWTVIPQKAWDEARQDARARMIRDGELEIYGYDVDPAFIPEARRNAKRAGVRKDIVFEQKDVRDLWIDRQYGMLISNPPYGVKMGDFSEINRIYISLNKTFRKKRGWSVYILTADKKFPDYFKRSRPDRVRKLFNGPLEVNFYQYFGERPPREG